VVEAWERRQGGDGGLVGDGGGGYGGKETEWAR